MRFDHVAGVVEDRTSAVEDPDETVAELTECSMMAQPAGEDRARPGRGVRTRRRRRIRFRTRPVDIAQS
ncbi:hypothetical protein ACFWDA_26195, partial [Rhodococcus zopfii]|uniref:hypothetical protein n=1 Tax=Rhodococcus zopfii TaxID=43772 RepID=UPI003652825A